MNTHIKKFADPSAVAKAFASDFAQWVATSSQQKLTVALSGGSTPKLLFELWSREYADAIDWSRIHFFWGDERCVPPTSSDSNYGVANALFLSPTKIPPANVHRVLGEASPEQERARYENEIREFVDKNASGTPQFDMVILGMGEDGHTASIFPHRSDLLESKRICEVATHPDSGQQRITITGNVINAAKRVAFLITGQSKAEVLRQVILKIDDFRDFPAAHICAEQVDFYLDTAATSKL